MKGNKKFYRRKFVAARKRAGVVRDDDQKAALLYGTLGPQKGPIQQGKVYT